MTAAVKDVAQIAHDRRELLAYVLEEYRSHKGKLVLPIGCESLETWLLDALNVDQLLDKLRAGCSSVDALQLCHVTAPKKGHKKTPSNATDVLLQPSTPPKPATPPSSSRSGGDIEPPVTVPTRRTTSSKSESSVVADVKLELPQLETTMDAGELRDLAYHIYVACCGQQCSREVLSNVRSHLELTESRANDIEKTLQHLASEPGWTPQQGATLELQVRLLELVRPRAFRKFSHFNLWRCTMGHVLLESLLQAIRDGWDLNSSVDNRTAPTAKSLVCRLKGALRRLDVRDHDDYFDAEYDEAVACVSRTSRAIAAHVQSGFRLPWGLRMRIAENLLQSVFDSLEESAYVATSQELLSTLEHGLWRWLGIGTLVHTALLAWVHFKQYMKTHDTALLHRIKDQLKLLHQAQRRASGAQLPGGSDVLTPLDKQLAQAVMDAIMHNMQEQLSDYHLNFQDKQAIHSMSCLVEVLALTAELGGGTDDEVQQMLIDAVGSSVDKEMARRLAAMSMDSDEHALQVMADVVRQLLNKEQEVYLRAWQERLPHALSVAAFRLHRRYGAQRLLPWISSGALEGLDEAALEVVRLAEELETDLYNAILPAFKAVDQPVGRTIVAEYRSWEIEANIQPALSKWVLKQTEGCGAWVTRGLEQERWDPLSMEAHHSLSAQELMRILHETLNALFDLNIKLPVEIISMLLESIDHVVSTYALHIKQKLDTLSQFLVPPTPTLTRYKQQLVAQNEKMELQGKSPKIMGLLRTGSPTFMASVDRVEHSPAWSQVNSMKDGVLCVMMASLQYLLEGLETLQDTVGQRWGNRRTSGSGRTVDLLEGMFDGARQVLRQTVEGAAAFMATKVVFWDMRQEWLEMLYRHRVANANIDSIYEVLERRLVASCNSLPQSLHNVLALALLNACAQAYERVLLDGGPCRWFIPDDVTPLRQDVERLQNLFLADGEGLEWNAVKNALQQVEEVLRAMGTATGPLMQQLEQAKLGHTRFEGMYKRVLAHRADKTGSKFLKLHYKLSKPKQK